ncbi:hypothetical protein [Rhizobium lusitanum]|uniref:Uncharacterized protein n=1 Tax=Rhizobium lusitanum TaxID=293958 RepID=A0A7X0IWW5_9HYPH|nr:hypothetical protein [Rhizobium lusitanum]MBB6488685.1 hypothetical protein [Rhizobium lusitanum]
MTPIDAPTMKKMRMTARADNHLPWQADQVRSGEFAAGAAVRVVAENIATASLTLGMDAVAGPVAVIRGAQFRVDERCGRRGPDDAVIVAALSGYQGMGGQEIARSRCSIPIDYLQSRLRLLVTLSCNHPRHGRYRRQWQQSTSGDRQMYASPRSCGVRIARCCFGAVAEWIFTGGGSQGSIA